MYASQVNNLYSFRYFEIGLKMIIAQNSKHLELWFMVIALEIVRLLNLEKKYVIHVW